MTVTESVPDGCRTASSATQELDDLMASLSDFKVRPLTVLPRAVISRSHGPLSDFKVRPLTVVSRAVVSRSHGITIRLQGTASDSATPGSSVTISWPPPRLQCTASDSGTQGSSVTISWPLRLQGTTSDSDAPRSSVTISWSTLRLQSTTSDSVSPDSSVSAGTGSRQATRMALCCICGLYVCCVVNIPRCGP